MTTQQRRALASYVREVADRMGLVEWKLILAADRPDDLDDNSAACCQPVFGHAAARMWFRDDWLTEQPEWQRYVVVHELLHIHLDDPWLAWARPVEDQVGGPAYHAITANAVTAWERCIDRIARSWAVEFPFPDTTATPDAAWIGWPADGEDLPLYSRLYDPQGVPRPAS